MTRFAPCAIALLLTAGCWNQFEDPQPTPVADDDVLSDDDTSAPDDDTSINDDDTSVDDDTSSDDDTAPDDDTSGDDDTPTDDDTVADDDTTDDDTSDDDSEVEDDDSEVEDDDSATTDDDSADDDSALGDDDNDDSAADDDDSAGDDDSATDPGPCPPNTMWVTAEVTLTDSFGAPATTLSTSSALTITLTLTNEGGTATTQYYGSDCLFQATLWDSALNPVGGGRMCTPGLLVQALVCGAPPVTDTWDLWPYYNLSPTVPLPPGPYTLQVDTYFYGVESFAVTVL